MGDFVHYRRADVFSAFCQLDPSYLSVLRKLGLLGLLPFLLLCAAAIFVAFMGLVLIGIESGTSRPTGSTWSGSC